ncbi:CheY-like superfamily [Haematococcus lacustris]
MPHTGTALPCSIPEHTELQVELLPGGATLLAAGGAKTGGQGSSQAQAQGHGLGSRASQGQGQGQGGQGASGPDAAAALGVGVGSGVGSGAGVGVGVGSGVGGGGGAGQVSLQAEGGAGSPAARPPPLRILIAEDNKINQKVVLKVLQQVGGGCTPDVVENGLEVLKALETKSYDLILMDIHMPLMDGLEATRRIVAQYPAEVRPRIIALSADTLQALHDRCREAGIEEFIVKPFRVEDLKRVVSTRRRTPCAFTPPPGPTPSHSVTSPQPV